MDKMEDIRTQTQPEVLTVGGYLATPTGASFFRRVSRCLIGLSAIMWLIVIAIHLVEGRLFFGNEILFVKTINLSVLEVPLIVLGSVLAALATIVQVVSRMRGKPKGDKKTATKKTVLAAMTQCPRMGVTQKTLLSDVRIKCEFVPKTGNGAIRCWCENSPFIPQDFSNYKAADFDAVDCMVVSGKLYVFFDIAAKRLWLESKNRKRGRND